MIRTELERLQAENEALKEKIAHLEKHIYQLETHQTLFAGARGESIISKLVDGEVTAYGESHDIEIGGEEGLRLEVKMASLNRPVKHSNTLRWAWSKILGESGDKDYDWLILIGKKDERYLAYYPDLDSAYVFFAVPKTELTSLLSNSGKKKMIYLTTNPRTTRSRTAILFKKYMLSQDQLSKQFGL
ncbi:hypothetical protein [Neptuniibacter sp. QD57_21]|uniref:hypothetical protein n=1 Tax=Neptuniibacter sp. QD57_21 TaxID=3398213 RepID=UPI0039F544E4